MNDIVKKIVKKETWVYNGIEYPSERDALNAQVEHIGKRQLNYEKFLNNSYTGKSLLEKYRLSTPGIWRIIGEGEPDFNAGPGPVLGYLKGTLEQAIRYAVVQPRWFNWGSGGSIDKIEVIEL